MTSVLTTAPVAFSKASMACLGSETLFCATHMVRWTPLRLAVASTEPDGAAEELLPLLSLQAVAVNPRAQAMARAGRVLFIGSSSYLLASTFSGGAGRSFRG